MIRTIIVIIIINIILTPVYAAESTPSASIQQKLDELKTSIASKAAKLKGEISKNLNNKFFYGSLILKSTVSLDLETLSGQKKIIINQDTIFEELGRKKSKFSYKTLVRNDYIAALGEIDDQGLLHAKKVILLPSTINYKPKTILWGQITSEDDKFLVIRNRDKKIIPVYKNKINTPYKLGDTMIITGYMDKDDILEASFSASVKSLTVSIPRQ